MCRLRKQIACFGIAAAWCVTALAMRQAPPATPSVLQERYDRAQQYQASGNLAGAAEQYRIFLADALGELASGFAQAHVTDRASQDFEEALRLVPDFPLLRLQYARMLAQNGNLHSAQAQAEQVLAGRTVPASAASGAHEVLGRVLLKEDHTADARNAFEEAVALDSNFQDGYELAVTDLDLGDEKAAGNLFAEMLKAYGDQAVLHLYFGTAYAGSDFQAAALPEFKKALALNPVLPGLHYCLAAAYLAQGETHSAEAQEELRKEIALSPRDGAAYAALGHLLLTQATDPERFREAEQPLRKATMLAPDDPDAYLFLGQLLADTNRPEEAIAALRRSIALTSDPARNGFQVQKAHYLLGRLLLKSGNADDGRKELALAEELLHRNLHRDQNRLSQFLGDGAGPDLSSSPAHQLPSPAHTSDDAPQLERVRALETRLAPALADSYNNLGAIAAGQSRFSEAVAEFEQASRWEPGLEGLDFNWGRAAFAAGLTDEAINPLRHYLRAHPGDTGAQTVLGLCLFQEKNYDEARRTLAPVAGQPQAPVQVRFVYAESLVHTGDVGAGVAQLEELAKANPALSDIQKGLAEAYALQKGPGATSNH